MSKKTDTEVDLSGSLLRDPGDEAHSSSPAAAESSHTSAGVSPDGVTHTLSCEQLISWQRSDTTLSPLFKAAVSGDKMESLSTGYFVQDGLLMRKWTSLSV